MPSGLSARQAECLRLTAFLTDKEIAARLGLSEPTVKKHVHEACRRLGVNRRKAALAILERNGGGTKDPIDGGRYVAPSAASEVDGRDGAGRWGGRVTGGGSWPDDADGRADGGGRTDADPSGAGADARPDRDRLPPSASMPEPGGRLGYRPPPRGIGFRLLMILALVVVGALVAKSVVDLVVGYTDQVRALDRAVYPEPTR